MGSECRSTALFVEPCWDVMLGRKGRGLSTGYSRLASHTLRGIPIRQRRSEEAEHHPERKLRPSPEINEELYVNRCEGNLIQKSLLVLKGQTEGSMFALLFRSS